jgi:hypothetical protein
MVRGSVDGLESWESLVKLFQVISTGVMIGTVRIIIG